MNIPLVKIVSGGQNGVDEAGLRAAKAVGLATGGWAPRGFKTLDGPRPDLGKDYGLLEHESSDYPPRTLANVRDSDGTIRLADDFTSPGEVCTLNAIRDLGRPWIDVDLRAPITPDVVHDWIRLNGIKILNVAGNSERTSPGIGDRAFSYLLLALGLEHEFSASQIEADERCRRYFWFRHLANLPEEQSDAQRFGTVLHGVVERWLKADSSGRGSDGKSIDLYPAGWDEGISPVEADLVKKLVTAAVESAVIERHPGTFVEAEFRHVPLVPRATIRGYIDVVAPDGIHDHKTSKNVERYAKSPAALRINTQLLLYSKIWLEDRKIDGKPIPERVLIRHNYFSKNPAAPIVRPVTAYVTPDEVETAWNRVQVRALEMLDLKRAAGARSMEEVDALWRQVPGAAPAGALQIIQSAGFDHPCGQYGGCPYADVCGGTKKPSEYAAEVSRRNEAAARKDQASAEIKNGDQKIMGTNIFAARLAANGTTTAPPAATTAVIPPPATTSSAPVAAATSPQQAIAAPPASTRQAPVGSPPWGRVECGACAGVGFNSRGDVCRPCRGNANSQGKPSPDWFELSYDDGEASWEVKKEHAADVERTLGPRGAGGAIRIVPSSKAVVQERAQAPSQASPQPAQPFAAQSPVVQVPQAASTQQAPPQTPSATPQAAVQVPTQAAAPIQPGQNAPTKFKFTLCVGCLPKGVASIRLEEVIARQLARMAQDRGLAHFAQIPVFDRRDLLTALAPKIAEEEKFGSKWVACERSQSPDVNGLIEALEGIAAEVVVSTGR